jgi:phosphoenolpyruvate-protein phosphotransferase/dihydroxyacetone kinase phosphotransfer subunit
MVGIVIVSHSLPLAQALEMLVRQVASSQVPIALAAGAGTDGKDFGSDAMRIMGAIQSVDSPDGVLVLMDLGSAILSAEMALDFLSPEIRQRVRLCPAPLVEGAIAAGVQSGLGGDLFTVCQEARNALLPKLEQLGQEIAGAAEAGAAPVGGTAAPADALKVEVSLVNPHGLHARPAARFVQLAASFEAQVTVINQTNGKGPAPAASLNALAILGARQHHRLLLSTSGPQAAQALEALRQLIASGFGESEAGEPLPIIEKVGATAVREMQEGVLRGVAVSDGIAIGPLHVYQPPRPVVSDQPTSDPQADWERFESALAQTKQVIEQRRKRLADSLGEERAAIFDAHLLILQDPQLLESVRQRLFTRQQNIAAAWRDSIGKLVQEYHGLEDPYQQARAADVQDVGDQLLTILAGEGEAEPLSLREPSILYMQQLKPSQVSQMDPEQVLGLVTTSGGATSHSAILARSLGLPAVSGLDLAQFGVPVGATVALDGFRGMVWLQPRAEEKEKLQEQRHAWLNDRQVLLQESHHPAVMRDGRRIEVAANVGSLLDAQTAATHGADGIGVLRTEFLYLRRVQAPSEDEQAASLCAIGEALGGTPVIVRTLDVGGDKDLPYIQMPEEANPFLGMRAIRLSLRQPALFLTQLRAILRAASHHNLQIMLPMIANLGEVLQARELLEHAHLELERREQVHGWPVPLGMMVEIPSAALLSAVFAPHVDFFSVGTNDLTQYTLAAERGNPALAGFLDALHPAVLQLIQQVVQAAHQYGKWAGVCGEVAGDPQATAILVGLGVDELSMNPVNIPRIKSILRNLDQSQAKALASQALGCQDASQVRRFAEDFSTGLSSLVVNGFQDLRARRP